MKKLIFLNLIMLFATSIIIADCCECRTLPIIEEKSCSGDGEYDRDLFHKCRKVIFANAEFLYWTASCGDNDYAFKYDQTPATLANFGLGKFIPSNYGWDPGFRIGVGYFNAPKTYQIYGQFIWINIDKTNSIKNSDLPLNGTYPALGLEPITTALSKVKLMHELGDLFISRVWYPNLHLRLRLFGGLTGGEIEQRMNITYTDVLSNIEKVNNRWKFMGIGFRLGIDFDWFWSSYFFVTGKLSMAPLIGKHKNFSQIVNTTSSNEFEHFTYDEWRGAYNVQAYLGPSYQRAFCKTRFEIFAGYELNAWFNVHEIIRINQIATGVLTLIPSTSVIPAINSGLIMLHGLTARFTLDY